MSAVAKILTKPVKLFQKHVIAFLIVRRHDLGIDEDLIRYVSLKPSASIHVLRQKIWHLLDLPDYCDEIIVLKTSENVEIPLTALRKGNEPNRPFILEIWLPVRPMESMTSVRNHMLTMGCNDDDNMTVRTSECSCCDKGETIAKTTAANESNCMLRSTITENTLAMHKLRVVENSRITFTPAEFQKPDLCGRISNTSFFLKLQGKKSKDNFANVLLKIQNDLSTLSEKLSSLENRIPS